ncbi:MAG: hypothetical protein ACRDIA_03415 [Actinomycetota bacterium]
MRYPMVREEARQSARAFVRRFTLGHIGQFNKALRSVHQTAFGLFGEIKQLTMRFKRNSGTPTQDWPRARRLFLVTVGLYRWI